MKIGKPSIYLICILGLAGLETVAVESYKAMQAKQHLSSLIVDVNRNDVFLSTRPTVGNSNAPVRLVVFGDYQCPPCRQADVALMHYVEAHPSAACFQFRNNPLASIHPLAEKAALCAEESSSADSFWKLHRELYDSQDKLSSELLDTLRVDKANPITRSQIEVAKARIGEDAAFAKAEKLVATPTIFVVTENKVFRTTGYSAAIKIASSQAL